MSQESKSSPSHQGVVLLSIVFGCWAIIVGLSLISYAPSEPRSGVGEGQFSAERAGVTLELLVGDSIPHPAGSDQNRIVRNRIVGLLESYGYDVEIQDGIGQIPDFLRRRSPGTTEVELHNIIAIRRADASLSRTESTTRDRAIMLASHYDSVPMGPGASDDGVGTAAVLEIARILATERAPERDIVFLISDGEEFGLLGARLFVDEHPLANRIGTVVNLEARGTRGPSIMFETSRHSGPLIGIFSDVSSRPFCSSLFYEVYQRLPRDTDFTAFKEKGMLGYNFAFIGNVRDYHTPADSIENVDMGCLQHHGDNALGLIRGLLNTTELDDAYREQVRTGTGQGPNDEAVYFDVFGRALVTWPSTWSVWICVIALGVLAVSAFKCPPYDRDAATADFGSRRVSVRGVLFHIALGVGVAVAVVATGIAIQMALSVDSRLGQGWPLSPIPVLCGVWFASFATAGGVVMVVSRWLDPRSGWISFCLIWLLFAFAASVFLNGASYLFIVPVGATVLVGALGSRWGKTGYIATAVVAAVSVGLIWLPLERIFYDAVGFKMPAAALLRMAMVATSLPMLLAVVGSRVRYWFAMAMTLLSVVAFVVAVISNSGI